MGGSERIGRPVDGTGLGVHVSGVSVSREENKSRKTIRGRKSSGGKENNNMKTISRSFSMFGSALVLALFPDYGRSLRRLHLPELCLP
jgi:hypothetical protein